VELERLRRSSAQADNQNAAARCKVAEPRPSALKITTEGYFSSTGKSISRIDTPVIRNVDF